MSSLLARARELKASLKAAPVTGPTQVVSTTVIDVETELDAFATAVEAELPKAELREAYMEAQGLAVTGEPMVPFAVKSGKAYVTVWYSGKVVWAGLSPIKFG